VPEPGLALGVTDRKWCVAHAEPRMAALIAVPGRTAPVLDQEQAQVLGRAPELLLVGAIEWAQDRVLGDG